MILRGLVLKQPWSWACIQLGKDVENRSRPLKHRGPLVIVAGARQDERYENEALVWMYRYGLIRPAPVQRFCLQRGGIIGCVEMHDVAHPDQYPVSPWHMPGQFGYQIRKAVPLPFRAIRGGQGLMKIEMTDREIQFIERAGIPCREV